MWEGGGHPCSNEGTEVGDGPYSWYLEQEEEREEKERKSGRRRRKE